MVSKIWVGMSTNIHVLPIQNSKLLAKTLTLNAGILELIQKKRKGKRSLIFLKLHLPLMSFSHKLLKTKLPS